MKMIIDENVMKKVEEITSTKYTDEYGYLRIDDVQGLIDDLLSCYSHLEEEFEDLKNDIGENYIPKFNDPYDEM